MFKRRPTNPINWANINLDAEEGEDGYVCVENTTLILDLVKAGLQSQIDGARQVFTRLGMVLTQASGLSTGALAALYWLCDHHTDSSPVWPIVMVVALLICWCGAAVCALAGMTGWKLAAVGIHPEDGLKQDVLGSDRRVAQIWAIKTMGNSLNDGQTEAKKLSFWLNLSIFSVVLAPFIAGGSLLLLLI